MPDGRSSRADHAWRVVASGLSFVIFGIGSILVSALFVAVVRPLPVGATRKRRWALGAIRRLTRFFVELIQSLGLMRYSVHGAERLDVRGHLVVMNHPSLIDALFLTARVPDLCCIVKRELFRNPFTSWLVRVAGYLPNDSDTLIDDAARVLREGGNLLVFPEGTRNPDDATLAFRRGAAHVIVAAHCPVLPVTIDMNPRGLQKNGHWYEMPARASTIRIDVHPALDFEDMIDARLPVTLQARAVNTSLREFFVGAVRRFAVYRAPAPAAVPERTGKPALESSLR